MFIRIWIDVTNPPQVQYLVPLKTAFENAGAEVTVTARNHGITLDLLRARGVSTHVAGGSTAGSRMTKMFDVVARAQDLTKIIRNGDPPDALVSASRSAALAARRMGIPSFMLTDYEYSEHRVAKLCRSYLVYPDVIGTEVFRKWGFPAQRLMAYPGLKEDLTFGGIDLDAAEPYQLNVGDSLVRVLLRPPDERSHYFTSKSMEMTLALIEFLSSRDDVVVVLSPRYARQAGYLELRPWRNPPIVLHEAIPFLSLLKAVDLVISSGGTMIREAAYLGLPAYSIFGSRIGSVDRYLEAIGRLQVLASPADFELIEFRKGAQKPVLGTNPTLAALLVEWITTRLSDAEPMALPPA